MNFFLSWPFVIVFSIADSASRASKSSQNQGGNDKEKRVVDRDKEKQRNKDKEKKIQTRRLRAVKGEYYYGKDRQSDIDKANKLG